MMTLDQIQDVAVIGSGTMGQGIAQVFAQSGFKTLIHDLKPESVSAAMLAIQNNLELAVSKNKITQDHKGQTLARILAVNRLKDVRADLIIEAIVEKVEVKQQLFQELEDINAGKAILATNTSSLPVTEIARGLRNPAKCVGLHFFNPAHLMKLVEIISGDQTDPKLVPLMKSLIEQLGKVPVVAKDSPGFIVNRVARHFYLEALKIVEHKQASIETVDQLLRSSGFKLGPFELMDLIGIDTNFAVTNSVYNGFHQAEKFRPSKIQEEKVKAGHLGRKSGKGFYDYQKV